uniref:Uncharacterized protein n=1 Tax=Branchiostoma floridae TaxID=7739 RepID=C3ZG45_BRAFL|eukprot:XP_002592509.1 hypothetical protein BRAFLDRAFT_69000 [Branchiostoma floridae]
MAVIVEMTIVAFAVIVLLLLWHCKRKLQDYLLKPVTEALQFSAQEGITDKPPTELTASWVWIVVVCLVVLVIAVGTVVTVVIIRKKKSIKGNHEDKIDFDLLTHKRKVRQEAVRVLQSH